MTKKVPLTVARIAELKAEPRKQVFLFDIKTQGLAVRLKGNGKPAYVFCGSFDGTPFRMTIGRCDVRTLPEAAKRARELQQIVDDGRDPRLVKAETVAKDVAQRKADEQVHITVAEVWPFYMATNGMPGKDNGWSDRYKLDLSKWVEAPRPKKVGKGLTLPGPLHPLMGQPLKNMTPQVLRDWYLKEKLRGKDQANRAMSMFSGFLEWAAAQDEYENILLMNAAHHPKVQTILAAQSPHRTNALQKSQLADWFKAIDGCDNKTMATYLKVLLLTGARKESLCTLKWKDIDFRWKAVSIHDKISKTKERRREIPLLPYTESIISGLPRVEGNEYVFASNRGEGKHIVDARDTMSKALAAAKIRHCTMHDLRRTYSKHAETAGVVDGAIRQFMGQKPSSTGQKYTPREVDDLRDLVEVAERYIVEQARIDFDFDGAKSGKVTQIRRRA